MTFAVHFVPVRRLAIALMLALFGFVASLAVPLPEWAAAEAAALTITTPSDGDANLLGITNTSDTLIFNSDRTGNHELFTMRPDGTQVRQLTSDSRYDSWWARVSPNRQRVLFYRTPRGVHDADYTQTSLWVMNTDGSGQRRLRSPGKDGWAYQGHAEWSPDSTQFVMFGGSLTSPQIFITDSEGRVRRQVTSRPGPNLDPSWSPDGSTILFIACPAMPCADPDFEVFTISSRGGVSQRLTFNGIRDHDPYYSPGGTHIAWLAETTPGAYGTIGGWDILLMQKDGTGQFNLTQDGQINSKPQWSPDGMRIYFHRFVVGVSAHWGLWALSFDGTGLTQITTGATGSDEYPASY